jgi:membrane-bound serine protease (ClpP class)
MFVAVTIGIGILLIILETILPGMIAGAAGIALMGLGVFTSFHEYGVEVGSWVLVGSLLLLIMIGILWIRYFHKTFVARLFISERAIRGEAGEELPPDLVGKTGTALTRLYSCGKIKIGDQLLDAVTNGEGIEKGAAVKVIRLEGIKIFVEEVKK